MDRRREERQAKLLELYEGSPIKHTMGIQLAYDEHGAIVDFPHDHRFENAMGGTHGGVLATLLDKAGWFTVAVAYDTWIATVDLHVQLLAPSKGEPLRATGRLVRAGKKLAMASMEVHEVGGRAIAIGSGTFSVTSVPFR